MSDGVPFFNISHTMGFHKRMWQIDKKCSRYRHPPKRKKVRRS